MTKSKHPSFRSFLRAEDGSAMVDWVVLAAALVGLGALVMAPIAGETDEIAQETGAQIESVSVGFASF